MRPTIALSLALSLLSSASCRRLHHRRPAPRATLSPRWFTYPAQGLPARVDASRHLRGAVRVEDGRAASAPWPAAALVATARLADGQWLFASEDGSLYRAPTFAGRITSLGGLPVRGAPLEAEGGVASVRPRSEGALFVVDPDRDAWKVDAAGAATKLPIARVLNGLFVSPSEIFAVVEPGALLRSTDGGASFSPVALPGGAAITVSLDESGVAVRTTEGDLRWRDGALAVATDVVSPAAFNALDANAQAAYARVVEVIPDVPWRPGALASNPDGTVSVVRGDEAVTVDPRTSRERSRVRLPGEDCSLARASDGLRAVCRQGGWAMTVSALADGASAWSPLRDERNAEPTGPAFFDRASRAWIVGAPCRQRTEPDTHRVCYYPDVGEPVEVRLPFAAVPVSMHAGAALVIDGESRRQGSTRAAIVRGSAASDVFLPGGVIGAQTATLDGDALMMWDVDPGGEHILALVRGERANNAWTWRRVDAPSGARRGVFAAGGRAIVAGSDASLLAMSVRGGAFEALPSPVEGAGAAFELDMAGQWFCAGPWCRLGGNLLLSTVATGSVGVVARHDAAPAIDRTRRPRRVFECHPDGVPVAGVEMDHGGAVSGYALRATVQGESVSLTWYGATLRGAATVRWPGPAGELFRAIGAVDATTPGAIVERCTQGRCERAFASPAGLVTLPLPATMPGTAALHATADGWIARADDTRFGAPVVTLVSLDARGAVRARRTYALSSQGARADAGTLASAAGLWVREGAATLRFHPIDGGATREAEETSEGCDPAASAEGAVFRVGEPDAVRGEDWLVDPTEWQVEERLRVTAGRACVASIAGGEPRDEVDEARGREHTPVRTFVLRATGHDGASAQAWAGRQVFPQRCALRARR